MQKGNVHARSEDLDLENIKRDGLQMELLQTETEECSTKEKYAHM